MRTFFTSDHHFDHTNIIKYANRPFSSVQEMNDELVRRWNEVVSPEDVVYYLGDFTLGKEGVAHHFLDKLNFHQIFMMAGNHDGRWMPYADFGYFRITKISPIYEVNMQGQHIVLSHYSMRTWNRSHYGAWHLFGHTHGTLESFGKSFDVGVDTNDYFPYSFEQVQAKMETLTMIVNHPVRERG